MKLLPSKGTGMAGNTVIDLKLTHSASLSTPVAYTTMPTGFDIPTPIPDVRPTASDVQPTVADVRPTVRLLHCQL